MSIAIEQLGWPDHAADEKGVLMWRSKVMDPAGEVVAKLGRYPDGISCEIKRYNLAPPFGVQPIHMSEWTLDGQLKAFEQYGAVRPLDDQEAAQAFVTFTQLMKTVPGYDCLGQLSRVTSEPPAVVPPVTSVSRPVAPPRPRAR